MLRRKEKDSFSERNAATVIWGCAPCLEGEDKDSSPSLTPPKYMGLRPMLRRREEDSFASTWADGSICRERQPRAFSEQV